MTVSTMPTLWYENDAGERWEPDLESNGYPAEGLPSGFCYQHSQFPNVLRHTILRLVQESEVNECPHLEKDIEPTGGWVSGIEGRKCKQCGGSQTKRVSDPWPQQWDAYGSQELAAMESSYSEDLVLAMANSGDYTLSQAILVAANACERCMNSLAEKYGLEWGYPEYSVEWERSRTECEFCVPKTGIIHK